MVVQVAAILIQATFAGMMIGGSQQAAHLHELTGKILVILSCAQTLLAISLRAKDACPLWIPVASGGLLTAEAIEFSAGHFHYVALHVPLGVAIFGGALRQLLWATRELPRSETAFSN
jgi:hypothetical protein